jgi:hypothetical protein
MKLSRRRSKAFGVLAASLVISAGLAVVGPVQSASAACGKFYYGMYTGSHLGSGIWRTPRMQVPNSGTCKDVNVKIVNKTSRQFPQYLCAQRVTYTANVEDAVKIGGPKCYNFTSLNTWRVTMYGIPNGSFFWVTAENSGIHIDVKV